MNPPPDEPQREAPASTKDAGDVGPHPGADEWLVVLRHMERALEEIRGRLEATARARQHREFSLPRLLGALCQMLVVGLVGVALADWTYQGPSARLLVELVLAGVLQLGALTAYVLARDGR
jgi:hypothetical protein